MIARTGLVDNHKLIINQHQFHIDSVTANSNIESMSVKHEVATLIFWLDISWLQDPTRSLKYV
jgi:hypothetical protein